MDTVEIALDIMVNQPIAAAIIAVILFIAWLLLKNLWQKTVGGVKKTTTKAKKGFNKLLALLFIAAILFIAYLMLFTS